MAIAAALVFASCALPGMAPRSEATAEEQEAYEAAQKMVARNPEAGREALTTFLDRYPDGPLSDDAARQLADLALARGDVETAITWLGYIVRKHGEGDQADDALLLLARLEIDRGRPEEARKALRRARFTRWTPERRLGAFRLLAESAENDSDRVYWLASVREAERDMGDDRAVAETDQRIDTLVASLSADELEETADQLGRRIPAARVRLRLASVALEAGDLERARDELERASRLDLAPEYAAARAEVEREIALRERVMSARGGLPTFRDVAALPLPHTESAQGTIGVVLPLTGDFAPYGERCLQGILLAAGVFDELGGAVPPATAGAGARSAPTPGSVDAPPPDVEPVHPKVRIVVRDSAGDPARAAAAVRSLAEDPDLVAIVGPLLSDPADAAAKVADEVHVPLLTLATRDEVAAGRSWVFRLRTTPRDEVRSVLEYAFETLGIRRFAILYPATRYGRGTRDEFWQGVQERGGWVVAVSSYDPEATDFAEPIRRMIGYPLLTDAEKKALQVRSDALRKARRLDPEEGAEVRKQLMAAPGPDGQPLPPRVDFEALFIPDSYESIVLIAPQLAFHEVSGVRLLGTGDWLNPELLRLAQNHVRGAVFAAPFDPASRFEFVAHFVETFSGTFGAQPDLFAAHAYDATNLLMVQMAAGRDDRDDVREGIVETQGYPGASGVLSILLDGNAQKRPYLMGVRGSSFISLD